MILFIFLIGYILSYFSSGENLAVSADLAILVFFFFYFEGNRSWPTGVSYSRIPFYCRTRTKTSQEELATTFSHSESFRGPWSRTESFHGGLNCFSHTVNSFCIWMTTRTLFSGWYWSSSQDSMSADVDKLISMMVRMILPFLESESLWDLNESSILPNEKSVHSNLEISINFKRL